MRRIAYGGIAGSYSHGAALRLGGSQPRSTGTLTPVDGAAFVEEQQAGVVLLPQRTFHDAAQAVIDGDADEAVLPIENSTAGSINETYDLLISHDLRICRELVLRIDHCLLGLPGAAAAAIETVRSHPQALAQCAAFLRQRPRIEVRPGLDTASAAREVASEGDASVAAIASAAAAEVYGLSILAERIQDVEHNYTRFVAIGAARDIVAFADRGAPVEMKTSLAVTLTDRPGALAEILGLFAARQLTLTKLESRPLPAEPFRYRFYLDLADHAESPAMEQALREARAAVVELRVLGTYPAWRATPAPQSP